MKESLIEHPIPDSISGNPILKSKETIHQPKYSRIISDYKVNAIFTVPTAFRVIHREDPEIVYGRKYSTSSLRTIFVAGEHCDYETKSWAEKTFNVPVLNHWWQTETGHAITATCVGLEHNLNPPKYTTGRPFFGYDIKIFRPDGTEASAYELGRIVVKLPLPPGTMTTLYQAPERFCQVYFNKYQVIEVLKVSRIICKDHFRVITIPWMLVT